MTIPTSTAPGSDRPDSPVVPHDAGDSDAAAAGLSIKARTQGQLVFRRFVRHRGAMAGLFVFVAIVLLAVTSIGMGPIPGWWDKNFTSTGSVVDGGRPTLDVLPSFVDGDGFAIGENPFGQDSIGRDYFATTMRGAQLSLQIALIVGLVSTVIGTVVGSVAGYFGGITETVLMRLVDVIIAIPLLVLAAVVARSTDGSALTLGLLLGIAVWTSLARLVRGEVLSIKEREFVEAARAMGASIPRILVRHVLPNVLAPTIVITSFSVATFIITASSLSFLGLGLPPSTPDWGLMIAEAVKYIRIAWWPSTFAGLALSLTVFGVNVLGDWLRDFLDPRLRLS